MLSRHNKHQLILTYLIGFMMLVFACMSMYRLLYVPMRTELRHLHQEITDETPNSITKHVVSLGTYQPWMQSLAYTDVDLRKQMVAMLSSDALHVIELRFLKKKQDAEFFQRPVYLKLSGAFPNIVNFFTRLANSHLVFTFEDLHLSQQNHLLQAVMQLRFKVTA